MHTMEISSTQCADKILAVLPIVTREMWARVRTETPIRLTRSQFEVFLVLEQQPHSMTELARQWGVSKPSMSKMISTMVERGWLVRMQDPTNPRRKPLSLTPLGRRIYEAVYEAIQQNLIRSLEGMNKEQLVQIASALDSLLQTLP